MDKKISPRRLAGFWELTPEKEMLFEEMIDKIKSVFRIHGFLPLDTPVMELTEVLLAKSGGDIDKEIYRFVKGSTDACLRYDFTVPLARYVAMNENEILYPFKRFQIGKVYRGERPQKGRFREFYQCDADIVAEGNLSLANDAECVKLYEDIFSALGIKGHVEVSSRKVLFGLVKSLGQEERYNEIAIILDKTDKIGQDQVQQQLLELGLSKGACQKLLKFISLCGDEKVLKTAKSLSNDQMFCEGLDELEKVFEFLRSMGCQSAEINFGIIRGHNYYTGVVFEAFLDEYRSSGAVGGGGRFDELASYFSQKHLPGVGMSIGLSRLFAILDGNNVLSQSVCAAKVAIIPLGETLSKCFELCSLLHKNGISAFVLGEEKTFKSKLKDAAKREIPFVAIIGEDEVKQGKVAIKDMQNSTQQVVTFDEAIKMLR